MNIEEYFNNIFKGSKQPSLDVMKFFMTKYDSFEKNMNFIHIAGTNGKGSCTEMLSAILSSNNYTVGKFISPHLISYNERICINNIPISDNILHSFIIELQPYILEYESIYNSKVSFFEIITFIGLLYFYRNNVDFVVLETGLGGLYDCTNIISKPLVSIITSIGYDHSHILGDTLNKITYQKAGIIKANSNTVIYDQNSNINSIFIDTCNKKNNSLHLITDSDVSNYSYDNIFQHFTFKNMYNISLNLKGKMQVKNCSLCLQTVQILTTLGFSISNISDALTSITHPARMEVIYNSPLIIFDGAHNLPAIKCFKENAQMYYSDFKKVYIISILKTKDYRTILKSLLEDTNALFIFTSGNDDKKFLLNIDLYTEAINYISKENLLYMSLEDSIKYSLTLNSEYSIFYIGSLYTYKTITNYLTTIKKQ